MFNQTQYYAQPEQENQPQAQEFPRAGIFERAVAFAIDILGLFAVIYIAGYILIRKTGIIASDNYWIILIFFYALFALYCAVFTSGCNIVQIPTDYRIYLLKCVLLL